MIIGLISFTKNGKQIQHTLANALAKQGHELCACDKTNTMSDWIASLWPIANLIIYIGATGIAVRSIAPHVQDKMTDPAVLVVDDHALHCISLLSGHVGGANDWAIAIADLLGANPVITTATDLQDVFAVDVFASKHRLQLSDRRLAKQVSARLLAGQTLPVLSERPWQGVLPNGLCHAEEPAPFGISIGIFNQQMFAQTLFLIPQVVTVGIGCKKQTSKADIEVLFQQVLTTHNLHPQAIKQVTSIDLKAKEVGLLDFCADHHLPFITYTASQLQAVEGTFTASEFVQSITTVDNVCERSAVKGSGNPTLLQTKISAKGVTLALSVEKWSLTDE